MNISLNILGYKGMASLPVSGCIIFASALHSFNVSYARCEDRLVRKASDIYGESMMAIPKTDTSSISRPPNISLQYTASTTMAKPSMLRMMKMQNQASNLDSRQTRVSFEDPL